MEVLYFLKKRTAFIRWYYDSLTAPLVEDQRKLEAEEAPYEPPYFDPDTDDAGEPPFMEEWARNKTAIDLVGAACVSMLSESLKLYFATWEKELGAECAKALKQDFKSGFINGYRACFGHLLKTDWSDCSADFAILEQIVLARNSAQHAGHLETLSPKHLGSTRDKFPSPFFIGAGEAGDFASDETKDAFWLNPTLGTTREAML